MRTGRHEALAGRKASAGLAALAIWMLLALLSCKQEGKAPSFVVLSPNADELRTQFQADAGAVRMIMLVAPS